jgi:hypothetical protein
MPAGAVHVQKSQNTWGPRREVKMRKLVLGERCTKLILFHEDADVDLESLFFCNSFLVTRHPNLHFLESKNVYIL